VRHTNWSQRCAQRVQLGDTALEPLPSAWDLFKQDLSTGAVPAENDARHIKVNFVALQSGTFGPASSAVGNQRPKKSAATDVANPGAATGDSRFPQLTANKPVLKIWPNESLAPSRAASSCIFHNSKFFY
jgi:hypothetical protein